MKKLWLKIRAFFSTLTTWFAGILKKNDEIVKVVAPYAINVCNFIKEYNDSDLVNALKAWAAGLGGTWSKVAVMFINRILSDEVMDKVIIALNITERAAGTNNVADKLTLILNYVKTLEKNEKAVAWTTISASITSALSDGKISWQELYLIVKGIYDEELNDGKN